MNIKLRITKSILFVFIFHLVFSGHAQKTTAGKPNILFIFANDHCYDAIRALGINSEIITPNLDRLVESGVSFNNTYNMGAWQPAVCVASRAMLITGRYGWEAKQYDSNKAQNLLKEKGHTWPQLMEKAGYDTYMSGKFHLKIAADSIFEQVAHEFPGKRS